MLAFAVMPLLASCSAPASPGAAPAREINTRLDGWYRGQRIPLSSTAFCRDQPRKVWFRVERGAVEVLTSRHRRSARMRPLLTGTVSYDGEMALEHDAGHRATGRVEGDRVTAQDLPEAVAELRHERNACVHRYEATRSDAGDED